MGGRGMIKEFFFHRVFAEPGDDAQPPGDRSASAADGAAVVMGAPPGQAGTGMLGQSRSQRFNGNPK